MPTRGRDLFEATTGTFWETMMSHNGNVGYKIPLYQRQYNWNTGHLRRLLQDCLSGFHHNCNNQHRDPQYTYLGSIILTATKGEPSFDGESIDIVDGQQRLTTLILIARALFQKIAEHEIDIQQASVGTQEWLTTEVDAQKTSLYQCAVGRLVNLGEGFPFPKIIRAQDNRANSFSASDYRSPIAAFVARFSNEAIGSPKLPIHSALSEATKDDPLEENYLSIIDTLDRYLLATATAPPPDDDDDIEVLDRIRFRTNPCRSLFRRLEQFAEPLQHRFCDEITKVQDIEGLIRLLLFSSYLTQYVLLTRVETQKEEDAFDIFDALNTTGEPLTALETCKPLVTQFEQEHGHGYTGSESEFYWDMVDHTLLDSYPQSETRVKEVKELVTTFALYLTGEKKPQDLVSQRRYMRDQFQASAKKDPRVARGFVKAIYDLVDFRQQYWDREGLQTSGIVGWNNEDIDLMRLCLHFMIDMRTTLAIPILARYCEAHSDKDTSHQFLDAIKATAAFLALRRCITLGTAGIDKCFRDLMGSKPKAGGDPLCLGPHLQHEILPIDDLRSEYVSLLAQNPAGIESRETFVNLSRNNSIGKDGPSALIRFLILAASHHARPQTEYSGLLTRDDVVPGDETSSLTYANWIAMKYRTVEHIAPVSKPTSGWDPAIYEDPDLCHRLGNLVLLPEKENQSLGNANWDKKLKFYKTLASHSEEERNSYLEEAKNSGISFSSRIEQLLRNQEHLPLLNHIVEADQWSIELIELRTENLLELAWDQINSWLFVD
ncbi:DUF262 domain-containing protein [Candidatus Poriferisocius sp.]|uniref:DUF262 domain-containing protein n=1 Tax=Candidatus Poriferisocius sp. TaxID=3101276 RepID=UPI003B025ECF